MATSSPRAQSAESVSNGRELGGEGGEQQISAGFGATSAGAGAGEKPGPCPLKGRMSLTWGGEGFAIKKSALPMTEFGPSWERMQFFREEKGVSITASLQRSPRPAPPTGPAPSCPFATAPRSLTSASSLQPPLRHPFTTSSDVLLPPRGSCSESLSPLPSQGLTRGQPMLLGLNGASSEYIHKYIHTYTYRCTYIGAAWADEWLQEEGVSLGRGSQQLGGTTSHGAAPAGHLLATFTGHPLPAQPSRAPVRCWDGALFPEIAFKVVLKKKTP